jgi:hypothetical protein
MARAALPLMAGSPDSAPQAPPRRAPTHTANDRTVSIAPSPACTVPRAWVGCRARLNTPAACLSRRGPDHQLCNRRVRSGPGDPLRLSSRASSPPVTAPNFPQRRTRRRKSRRGRTRCQTRSAMRSRDCNARGGSSRWLATASTTRRPSSLLARALMSRSRRATSTRCAETSVQPRMRSSFHGRRCARCDRICSGHLPTMRSASHSPQGCCTRFLGCCSVPSSPAPRWQ